MNQNCNYLLKENSLDATVEHGKNKYVVKAIGIGAVFAVCLSVVLLAGFNLVRKVLTKDEKSVSVTAKGEIDWREGKASGEIDVTYSSGEENPTYSDVDDEDSYMQNPQKSDLPTVTVTAPKSCWIYNLPGSEAVREGYAEKGDVLPYIGKAYADGDPNNLFYKVKYIDKLDNKTERIGYMNAVWGELRAA